MSHILIPLPCELASVLQREAEKAGLTIPQYVARLVSAYLVVVSAARAAGDETVQG